MTSKILEKRKQEFVSFSFHKMTRQERDDFKMACAKAGMSQQDAIREMVLRVIAGNVQLTGEHLDDSSR